MSPPATHGMLWAMTASHASQLRPHVRTGAAVEEGIPRTYRAVMAALWPILRGWGRLQVVGAEDFPPSGPTLLLANHDNEVFSPGVHTQ